MKPVSKNVENYPQTGWLEIFQPILALGEAKNVHPNNYQIPLNQTSSKVMSTSLVVDTIRRKTGKQ